MSKRPRPPIPRLTVITLGVSDVRTSVAFYEALGFTRKFRATGEAVAFFDTGGAVLGLFPWHQLAHRTDYGGYSGYFSDPDGHPWEAVTAPGIEVGEDRRVRLPD